MAEYKLVLVLSEEDKTDLKNIRKEIQDLFYATDGLIKNYLREISLEAIKIINLTLNSIKEIHELRELYLESYEGSSQVSLYVEIAGGEDHSEDFD